MVKSKSVCCASCSTRTTVTYFLKQKHIEWVCQICKFINKIKLKCNEKEQTKQTSGNGGVVPE